MKPGISAAGRMEWQRKKTEGVSNKLALGRTALLIPAVIYWL